MTGSKRGTQKRSKAAPRSKNEVRNQLFFRLFRVANIYHRQAGRQLKLSAVQGAVLGALSKEGDAGIAFFNLSSYLSVSRQNLDAVLKGLEQLGFVERVESEVDRRVKMVKLTGPGKDAWDETYTSSMVFFDKVTRHLPLDELIACSDTLANIGRALQSLDAEAAPRAGSEAAE